MTDRGPISTSVVPWEYRDGRLRFLDQRALPSEERWIECATAAETAAAIRALAVRGAPLIGVAAAMGVVVEANRAAAEGEPGFAGALEAAFGLLVASRPTAVNLPAAIARMRRTAAASLGSPAGKRASLLLEEALRIAEEDRAGCLSIGRHGADFLERRIAPGPATILTHCNAGALATAGIGTALGVIRVLAADREVRVFADETRPFWQGARLTAWELSRDGFDVTLLPDVAAASVIASGRVSAVVVGADRIAANGDVANKVGTYGVALACRAHGVPFVVAAPTSTVDLSTASGSGIPIEMRSGDEVLSIDLPGGATVRMAPAGIAALYPAFDVTPAALVDAIVTERGTAVAPYAEALRALQDLR
jgi:methylthioribose-1-phosphate isomerase